MDGYDRYDIGMEMNTYIEKAERKMKDNEDDFFLLNKHSTPEITVLEAILNEVGQKRSELLNCAEVLRVLSLELFLQVLILEDFPCMVEA